MDILRKKLQYCDKKGLQMSENIVTVNEKKTYHNCALRFSMFSSDSSSDFKVDDSIYYCIHTTLKEVELLNEALNIYQNDNFKSDYLEYFEAHDAKEKFPAFHEKFENSQKIAKALKALANDEDALTQLQSYVLDIVPTYRDDYFYRQKA